MQVNPVAEDIKAFVVKHFPSTRSSNLGYVDQLLETGIVDSLGVLDLVAFLERQFGITVADEELTPTNFGTIEGMTTLVQYKNNHNPPPAG